MSPSLPRPSFTQPVSATLRVLNISQTPNWSGFKWFDGKLPADLDVSFTHNHCYSNHWIARKLTKPNLGLQRGCLQAAAQFARGEVDLLVSHLPSVTRWVETYLTGVPRRGLHVAWAFNQDPMPQGLTLRFARRLYRRVDRFFVFSSAERELYIERLQISPERIEMLHWGVEPPMAAGDPLIEGDYITAIGRVHRDYGALFEAMRRLPGIRAVVVAAPENLVGLSAPPNVQVLTNVPFPDTLNILAHSRFMVLPLTVCEVAYGHGTTVLAMHLKRPVLATAGAALSDYVVEGETGRLYSPTRANDLTDHIRAMWDDSSGLERMAQNAAAFAAEYCTEQATSKRVVAMLCQARDFGTV